jgi:predicted transposase YbfD/YdcC
MGCQRTIAEQVIDQQGDYVLGLNENQGTLHDEELDKGHGRIETLRYWISDSLVSLPNQHKWKGLRSIGMAEREYLKSEIITIDRRYFINSIAADAKRFASAVRGH